MQDIKFTDIYFYTTVCLQKKLLISVLQHSSKRVCDKFKKLGSLLYIMTNETNNCTVCGKDADKKCSRCKEVAYCSKECQAISWKTHKNDCKKIVKKLLNKLYECVKIEGKGDGLRAIDDIRYGEPIIIEEPVMQLEKVVIKKANPWRQLEKFPDTLRDSMKAQLEQRLLQLNETSEKYLKECFDKVPIDKQNAFMRLFDCHQDKEKTLLGIVSTNGLIQQNGETLVFLNISKLNNSCLPNVAFEFVPPYGRIYAVKDIQKGEELSIDYGGYGSRFSTLKERQEMLLDKYDFTCECELCTMDNDKYNEIESARVRYKRLEEQIPKTTDPQTIGSLIKERYEMMEKGQLMIPSLVALHANDSFQLANGLGNQEEARRYAKMAYDSLVIKYGKDNPRSKLYRLYLDKKINGNELVHKLSMVKMSV